LHWINVCDWIYPEGHTISFRQQYDIYSTPVIYILDEKKKIIAKRIGVEQVDEILDSYINKKPMRNNIQKAAEH
jgi:hypothetical protein